MSFAAEMAYGEANARHYSTLRIEECALLEKKRRSDHNDQWCHV